MSTRSQVIIKDAYDEQWFYRHSDGYPSGNLPQLQKLIKWYDDGLIRDNIEQSAGWLIIIGAEEYRNYTTNPFEPNDTWEHGSYEISVPRERGDIEYLYTINIKDKTLTIQEMYGIEKTFSWKEILNMNEEDFNKLDGGLQNE
jgi:hypothetical protein